MTLDAAPSYIDRIAPDGHRTPMIAKIPPRPVVLALFAALTLGGAHAEPNAAGRDEAGLAPLELLGKRVFEDRNLSRPAGVACASCHDPAKAFQGNNGSPIPAAARGSREGAFGARNTPTLTYSSFSPPFGFVDEKDEKTGKVEKIPVGGQFLDGRAADLVQQFEGPLLNPDEMNMPSKRAVVEAIRGGPHADLARRVLGENVFADPDKAFERIAQAVAAFENTERFHPFTSKFDAYLKGEARLTPLEARGFALFKDEKKGNCFACHVGKEGSRDPKDWLFTDFTYDTLGAPKNPALPATQQPGAAPDLGLCRREGLAALAPKDFDIASVCGAFKVPTLRNVAVTGPYLHNGVFAKLRDVVAFYATRDTNPERWYPKDATGATRKFDDLPGKHRANVNAAEAPYDRKPGQKPRLSEREIDAIVAFLETLTDLPGR